MNTPRKFKLVVGRKDGEIVTKQVLGYEVPVELEVLKVFTVKMMEGWFVADQRTGVFVGGLTPVDTEKEAVDNFLMNINVYGEESVLQGINDFLKPIPVAQEGKEVPHEPKLALPPSMDDVSSPSSPAPVTLTSDETK
jgi:hypothetical protein